MAIFIHIYYAWVIIEMETAEELGKKVWVMMEKTEGTLMKYLLF